MTIEFQDDELRKAIIWRGMWWWRQCTYVVRDRNGCWQHTNVDPSVFVGHALQADLETTRALERSRRERVTDEQQREAAWKKPCVLPTARAVKLVGTSSNDSGGW